MKKNSFKFEKYADCSKSIYKKYSRSSDYLIIADGSKLAYHLLFLIKNRNLAKEKLFCEDNRIRLAITLNRHNGFEILELKYN